MTSNPEVSYLRQLLGHCSRLQSREKQNSHRRQSPVLGHEEVPTSVASVTPALCPLLYQQVAFFFKGPPTVFFKTFHVSVRQQQETGLLEAQMAKGQLLC